MPLDRYFDGNGEKVLDSMRKTYGSEKKAESVFYALANKKHATPADEKKPKRNYGIHKT